MAILPFKGDSTWTLQYAKGGELPGKNFALGVTFDAGKRDKALGQVFPDRGEALNQWNYVMIDNRVRNSKVWLDGNNFIGNLFTDSSFAWFGGDFEFVPQNNKTEGACTIELGPDALKRAIPTGFEACQTKIAAPEPPWDAVGYPVPLLVLSFEGARSLEPLLNNNPPSDGQMTAREYYKKLQASGKADPQMANGYVCFQDDNRVDDYITFVTSKDLRDYLIKTNELHKLVIGAQEQLKKDALIVRNYQKDVPLKAEGFFYKDGDSWRTDKYTLSLTQSPAWMRLTVDWQTLRYKRAVEFGAEGKELATYGVCEKAGSPVKSP